MMTHDVNPGEEPDDEVTVAASSAAMREIRQAAAAVDAAAEADDVDDVKVWTTESADEDETIAGPSAAEVRRATQWAQGEAAVRPADAGVTEEATVISGFVSTTAQPQPPVPAPPPVTRPRVCLLYTSPSPRDATLSRMPSSA